jgi:lipid-A-disaccharide synthase-like uncharacterized protein
MNELLNFYLAYSLITGLAVLPVSGSGFMPFQDNYWLWKFVGFGGLAVFQARWIVQWLYSEAKKESAVPEIFWWLSLAGSLLELSYFLRQQDSVGVLGSVGGFTYARNLMLIYRKKRRDAALAPAASGPII